MISKRTIKYLRSLSKKKTQVIEKKFIAEGIRFFKEAVDSDFEIESVYILDSLVNEPEIQKILRLLAQNHPDSILQTIKKYDLELISETSTPQGILAVMHQKCWNLSDLYSAKRIVALENITDPGNLGTIIRTADWNPKLREVLRDALVEEGCEVIEADGIPEVSFQLGLILFFL